MTTGKEYGKMTKSASPPSPKIKNIINAFWTGGLICTIGQALNTLYTEAGFSEDEVNAGVSVTLIVTAACLTGLGVYDKIAKVAVFSRRSGYSLRHACGFYLRNNLLLL